MPEIVVVGSLKSKPGKEDDTRDTLAALVEPTHAEDGCILYSFHQGVEDKTRFAFIERWESAELLQQHLGSDHIATALSRADEILAEQPDIVVYGPIALGDERKGSLAGHAG